MGEALKNEGLPLTYDVSDTSEVTNDPVTSSAVSATDDVDIWIAVYSSQAAALDVIAEERANIASSNHEVVQFYAVCQTIVVDSGTAYPAVGQAEDIEEVINRAQALLARLYGPC